MKKTNEMLENKAENTDVSKTEEAREIATNVSNQNNGQNTSHHNVVEKAIQLSFKQNSKIFYRSITQLDLINY